MFAELPIPGYAAAAPLFNSWQHTLAPAAILAGHSPRRVFVDHPARPSHALIWDGAAHLYLAGSGQETGFHRSMGQILDKEIGPAMLTHGHSYYVLLCKQEITQSALTSLLPDRHPFSQKRRVYIFSPGQSLPPQRHLPLEAHIVPFNKALFESPVVTSSQPFMKWLQDTWQEPRLLLQYGFGICLLVGDRLAAWCMAENITDSSCEAGIETHPSFRRQGFAYLAARAFLAQCHERGLNAYWVCRENNQASSALAEKLGFGGRRNFTAWFGSFDAQEEQRILKDHNVE